MPNTKPAMENTQPSAVTMVPLMNEVSHAGSPMLSTSGYKRVGICPPTVMIGAATTMDRIIPSNTMPMAIALPQRLEIAARSNLVRSWESFFVFVTTPERMFSIQANLQSLV